MTSPEKAQSEFEVAMQSGIYTFAKVLFEIASRRTEEEPADTEENNSDDN